MRVLGVTAEYNPIHNGHIYHLTESRVMSKADFIVAVMSGDFTQRGEPAVYDKWVRSKMAVESGVDLVIELPFIYATGSAEGFAAGAVDIFNGLGCVTDISFGSESGQAGELYQLAGFLTDEPDEFKKVLKEKLKEGLAYPAARQAAVAAVIGPAAAGLLSQPNNILGVEYIKALRRTGSKIGAHTVRRQGLYGDTSMDVRFPSAAAIREKLYAGDREGIADAVPALPDERPAVPEDMWPALQLKILQTGTEELAEMYGIGEGIENRLKKEIRMYDSLEGYARAVKSKRYTRTGINRMLLHILMGLTKRDIEKSRKAGTYARILAAGPEGRRLLRIVRDNEMNSIPLLTNINRSEYSSRSLDLDILASDMYNRMTGRDMYSRSDMVMKPTIKP